MSIAPILLFLVVFTLIAYIGICWLIYSNQNKLLFYPEVLSQDFQFEFPFPFHEHQFNPNTKTSLNLLTFPVQDQTLRKGIVLYFHGNAGSLKDWGFVAEQFTKHHYEVWMPDYRRYGKSTGKLSQSGLIEDAIFIYKQIQSQNPKTPIVLFGRSLGTGVALHLAKEIKVNKILLESPFLSLLKLAKSSLPFLPVSKLLKYHFRNDHIIKELKTSTISIIHGKKDEVIPYNHSEELKELNPLIDLTLVEEGNHNDLAEHTIYSQWLNRNLA